MCSKRQCRDKRTHVLLKAHSTILRTSKNHSRFPVTCKVGKIGIYCTTFHGNKFEAAKIPVTPNVNLHLSWCFESKLKATYFSDNLIFKFKQYKNANIVNAVYHGNSDFLYFQSATKVVYVDMLHGAKIIVPWFMFVWNKEQE